MTDIPDDVSDFVRQMFGESATDETEAEAEVATSLIAAGNHVPGEGSNPTSTEPDTERQFARKLFSHTNEGT